MSKSNFQLYKEERENATVIEDDYGFAVAKEFGEYWYIEDIFVKKEYRQSKKATEYADKLTKIGKEKGFTKLLGSVDSEAQGANTSLQVLLGYKMKLHLVDDKMIYFVKEI